MTTLEQTRLAKEKLVKQLMDGVTSNAVGISKDEEGYFVSVGLVQEPEKGVILAESCDGVRVKYKVIGRIRPLATTSQQLHDELKESGLDTIEPE
jgi:hypothetical protein